MNPGETFRGFDFENHLWIVVSNEVTGGKIAVANVTSYRGSSSDSTCLIHPGEHPFVRHVTCVVYRPAYLADIDPLRRASEQRTLQRHTPLSGELLLRVQQGALSSRFTIGAVKDAVRASLPLLAPPKLHDARFNDLGTR